MIFKECPYCGCEPQIVKISDGIWALSHTCPIGKHKKTFEVKTKTYKEACVIWNNKVKRMERVATTRLDKFIKDQGWEDNENNRTVIIEYLCPEDANGNCIDCPQPNVKPKDVKECIKCWNER